MTGWLNVPCLTFRYRPGNPLKSCQHQRSCRDRGALRGLLAEDCRGNFFDLFKFRLERERVPTIYPSLSISILADIAFRWHRALG